MSSSSSQEIDNATENRRRRQISTESAPTISLSSTAPSDGPSSQEAEGLSGSVTSRVNRISEPPTDSNRKAAPSHQQEEDSSRAALFPPRGMEPQQQRLAEAHGDSHSRPSSSSSLLLPPRPPSERMQAPPEAVIHVAAAKSPTENMHLARKFLINHPVVALIAMESAIVIAIDAALLVERSMFATIERVQTDFVPDAPSSSTLSPALRMPRSPVYHHPNASSTTLQHPMWPNMVYSNTNDNAMPQHPSYCPQQSSPPYHHYPQQQQQWWPSSHAASHLQHPPPQEQQRAQIVITLKRTEQYVQWLADKNNHQNDSSTKQA